MRSRTIAHLAIVGGLATLGTVMVAARESAEASALPACRVTADAALPVGNPARAQLRFTDTPGDSLTASFPAEAGIEVLSIKRGARDDAMSAQLTVNSSYAVGGEWPITITGERGACIGTIWIERHLRKT